MRRLTVSLLTLIVVLLSLGIQPSSANNIHLRYFESADAYLTNSAFQLFSFTALAGEEVTIVAYGLDADLLPTITVVDVSGITLAEDLNNDQNDVAVVELVAPENNLYTFLVSRRSDIGGLVRVLLFSGDPLSGDLTRLDTVDPLLPGRAYLVAGGSADEPLDMAVTVLEEEETSEATTSEIPSTIFAARGSEVASPPLDERTTPVQQQGWENEEGDIFYTLIVRAFPDSPAPTSQKLGAHLSSISQVLDVVDIQLDLGQGGDPQDIPRPICKGNVIRDSKLLAGPGEQYIEQGSITAPQDVEILGFFGQYLLILDLTSPTGGRWILRNNVQIDETITSPNCLRVVAFPPPPLTEDNSVNGGGGGQQPDSFGGLPPGDNPPPDSPPNDSGGDGTVRNPDPPAGGDDGGPQQPSFALSCDGYNHVLSWSGLGPNSSLSYSHDSYCSTGIITISAGPSGSLYVNDVCDDFINITISSSNPPASFSGQSYCSSYGGSDGWSDDGGSDFGS
jgi:hypothetical protein